MKCSNRSPKVNPTSVLLTLMAALCGRMLMAQKLASGGEV